MKQPKTFILVDTLNMFFRCTHSVSPSLGVDAMAGMALHTIFNSVRKAYRDNNGDHIVFAHEGRKNWRKEFYPKYKLNRAVARLKQTEQEKENAEILFGALTEFIQFVENKTNTTNLRCDTAEADDMIAMFIQQHPDDKHIVISSDSDYIQLLKHPNVTIINGVTGTIMRQDGVYNEKNRKVEFTIKSDGKIKVGKQNPAFEADPDWYEFAMFLKMIRGDKSDNIFSAYPGARLKGTKNKVGITEAYEDKSSKGFKWNNFMLQRWVDEDDNEQIVKDCYERNRTLIDLEMQPDNIKQDCLNALAEQTMPKEVSNVGIHFMRFAGAHGLNRISDSATEFANLFNAKYDK